MDTIITATSLLFHVNPTEITLEESFPARIRVIVDETEMAPEHMQLSSSAASVVKRIAAAGIGCEVIFYIPIGCELHAGMALHDTAAEQFDFTAIL